MKLQIALILSFVIVSSTFAQSIVIGENEFPLGEDAFPIQAECLNPDGCGAEILYLGPPPLYPFYPMTSGLTASHILDVVPTDLSDEDDIRLEFPVPIVNHSGPDIYLAQADFVGELGLFDPAGINDFGIRFDNSPTWYTIPSGQFTQDLLAGVNYIYYTDSEIKSDAYYLWYAFIDLDDFGYLPGESVVSFNIRGPAVPAFPETVGLDVVTVASLNEVEVQPEIVITSPRHGDIVSGIVNIAATVFDMTPERVIFHVGQTRLCIDTAEPYECEWNTTLLEDGVYRIKVLSRDAEGNRVQDSVRVRVSNP